MAEADSAADPLVPFVQFFVAQADLEVVEPSGAVSLQFNEECLQGDSTAAGGDFADSHLEALGDFVGTLNFLSVDSETEEAALFEWSDLAFVLIDQQPQVTFQKLLDLGHGLLGLFLGLGEDQEVVGITGKR